MPDAPCPNCGSVRAPGLAAVEVPTLGLPIARCPDCDWPVSLPVPDAPFCAVCRRRHGPERTHAAQ